jgi:hypothetical protein
VLPSGFNVLYNVAAKLRSNWHDPAHTEL